MNKDVKELIQKINILINSLEETENDTIGFFNDVIDVIENCKSDEELKKVLDDHLIHAGKITDYGSFNKKQYDLFSDMWKVANSIYENTQDNN